MSPMAELSNALKHKLEHLFEMEGGYVLDFSNASFADFIRTSIHVDPYKGYDGSKATILRQLWHDLNDQAFAKLTLEMLDRWRTNKLGRGSRDHCTRSAVIRGSDCSSERANGGQV